MRGAPQTQNEKWLTASLSRAAVIRILTLVANEGAHFDRFDAWYITTCQPRVKTSATQTRSRCLASSRARGSFIVMKWQGCSSRIRI